MVVNSRLLVALEKARVTYADPYSQFEFYRAGQWHALTPETNLRQHLLWRYAIIHVDQREGS